MGAPALTNSPAARLDAWLEQAPGYERPKRVWGIAELSYKTATAAVRPPYPWLRDCLVEMSLGIRRSFWPVAISMAFLAYGTVTTAIGGVVNSLGTPDRYGAALVTGYPRESVFWVTAQIFAGVMGSAITADLAARKIRDELDAIQVLGVDPIKSLVVPRVVALMLIGPILGCFAMIIGLGVSYLTASSLNVEGAVFFESAKSFISSEDMVSVLLRMTVIGAFVGVLAAYKGMGARGGAEGVGKAVKETVIVSFFSLWLLNTLWNEFFLAVWRDVNVIRG